MFVDLIILQTLRKYTCKFRDLDADGRVIHYSAWGCGLSRLVHDGGGGGSMAGTCELSGCTKGGEFLELPEQIPTSQKKYGPKS
jgi:hypothetical protein